MSTGVSKPSDGLHVGQAFTAERAIVEADIAAFAALVGDRGQHHTSTDVRPMAHGLLTVSLATQIGGQLDFIARRMDWTFCKPVWAGDTITAQVTISELTERRSGTGVRFDVVIANQDGETVATGDVYGVIPY